MTPQEKSLHRLEHIFECFYKEYNDIERSVHYKELIQDIPEVERIWKCYKEAQEEARVIFEHRFEKLMERFK